MKITIKTLQQKVFQVFCSRKFPSISCSLTLQIDAENQDTIADLKKRIEEAHGHPVSNQKLINSGEKEFCLTILPYYFF